MKIENTPFELVSKDGVYALQDKNSCVAIITYLLNDGGSIDKIGVIVEKNPHFPEGSYTSLLMGKIESEDSSLLFRAKAELKKAGFSVEEKSRWDFLGEFYTSKMLTEAVYCYAVDLTDLKKETDELSNDSKFQFVPLNKAKKIPDTVLQTCFLKLFTTIYKQQLA